MQPPCWTAALASHHPRIRPMHIRGTGWREFGRPLNQHRFRPPCLGDESPSGLDGQVEPQRVDDLGTVVWRHRSGISHLIPRPPRRRFTRIASAPELRGQVTEQKGRQLPPDLGARVDGDRAGTVSDTDGGLQGDAGMAEQALGRKASKEQRVGDLVERDRRGKRELGRGSGLGTPGEGRSGTVSSVAGPGTRRTGDPPRSEKLPARTSAVRPVSRLTSGWGRTCGPLPLIYAADTRSGCGAKVFFASRVRRYALLRQVRRAAHSGSRPISRKRAAIVRHNPRTLPRVSPVRRATSAWSHPSIRNMATACSVRWTARPAQIARPRACRYRRGPP